MALQSILLLASLALAPAALAYEPDVTQERDETDTSVQAVDHLIPSGRGFPEGRPPIYYIARFGRYPSFSESFEWCVFRKKNRYVLSSWRLDRSDRKAEPRRVEVMDLDIPERMAATIYSLWANAILDARYAREGSGLDGTGYEFSTYLRGVGWPTATTESPSRDLPPKWLVDAGEEVLALARGRTKDTGQLLSKLNNTQRALDAYQRTRSSSSRPNKTMEPTR
jgi:hypothetical protein